MTNPTRTEEERRRQEIASEVERSLDEAGRRVELRVAYARAVAFSGLGLVVVVFKLFGDEGQAPASTIGVLTLGASLSVALVIVLRRGLYSPVIPSEPLAVLALGAADAGETTGKEGAR